VRAHWRQRLAAIGVAKLYAELQQRDAPLAERVQPTDKQRILRGLEVAEATGTRLSDWQKIKPQAPLAQAQKILLLPDRDWLYARCNLRFEQMMQGAALEEVEALAALKLAPETTIQKALGVTEIMGFLQGSLTREQAIEQAQQATRRYAKRQMTWFRNQMTGWESFSEQDYADNQDKIFSFISKNSLTTT
jgi:tRNA dimethylallyltransferase